MARGHRCGQVAFRRSSTGAFASPSTAVAILQAEVVLPRERTKGPDTLASPACRSFDRRSCGIDRAIEGRQTSGLGIALRTRASAHASCGRARPLPRRAASLHSLIVQTMARAVVRTSEIDAADGRRVAARRHRHLRLSVGRRRARRQAPGEGILGRVFSTGQAIVARDVAEQPDHARRRRYRSSSYLALSAYGPPACWRSSPSPTGPMEARSTSRDLAILMSFGGRSASLALGRARSCAERTRDLPHQATIDG